MSLLSKVNGFGFQKVTDGLWPKDRYINFDGSPYGSRHIWRFLSRPTTRANIALVVATAADYAFSQPTSEREDDFATKLLTGTMVLGFVYWRTGAWFNKKLPVAKTSVVDKEGRSGDPEATAKMRTHYRKESVSDAIAAVIAFTILNLGKELDVNLYPLFVLTSAIWNGYAARKLSKGKWSVETSPPRPETKKATATASSLAQATA